MEVINLKERINKIIQELQIKKSDFAEKLNISQAFVSQMCAGVREPSDRTISDICRVFKVNRRYLESGDEPMFMPELDEDTDYINELLAATDSPFIDTIKSIMRVYMELPPEYQKKFDAFVANVKDKMKKQDRD